MTRILVSNRDIVVPGDLLVEDAGEDVVVDTSYAERIGKNYYATVIGLVVVAEEEKEGGAKVKRISIIPLEGTYIPRTGDLVVGLIEDIGITHWEVDIRSPYKAILAAQDVLGRPFNPALENLTQYFDIGDYVIAKVASFSRNRDPILTVKEKGLGRVTEGLVIEVRPSRVPRIIGRKASMINMLVSETGCNIIVGQNGRIIIKCETKRQEDIAVRAIRMIEELAHTTGLTDRVREFIRKERGKEPS